MKYNIDEEKLMAYLYEEMSVEEKAQFEAALAESTHWQDELNSLQFLRERMNTVMDTPVPETIAIPIEVEKTPTTVRSLSWLKPLISIAAALALLLTIGKLTDFQMHKQGSSFTLSFGEPQLLAADDPNQELKRMVEAILEQQHNQSTELASLKQSVHSDLSMQEDLIQQVSLQSKNINKAPVQDFSLEQVAELIDEHRVTDRDAIEKMLVQLLDIWSHTREEDNRIIQANFDEIRGALNLNQFESQRIMASIQDNEVNQ